MPDKVRGQWGTATFAIPDYLEGIRDAVNNFAEVLVALLEVANLALEFAKAFIKGYIDPLSSLIEVIVAEVSAILRDLRQVGLYLTGDWALLGWPPEDLRGGYLAYERRMIARLTDRTDPTRPDVSGQTKVAGFFCYLSVDPSDFERLINFIITFLKMLGVSFFPDTSRMPIPTIKDTLYGTQAIAAVPAAFQFQGLSASLKAGGGTPPSQCRVTWTTQPASQKSPFNPLPILGPSGYLVTVSTLEQGLALKYGRPKQNTDKKPADGDANKKVQPREYGSVLGMDHQSIVLHGGAEMLSFNGSGLEYNKNIDPETQVAKDSACQVYGMLDPASNEVVPLELLLRDGAAVPSALGVPGDGKGHFFRFQRTFLIESDVALAQWFAGEYGAVLALEDMPYDSRFERVNGEILPVAGLVESPAVNYYVRVWAVGKEIATGKKLPQWEFTATAVKNQAATSGEPFVVGMKSGEAAVGMPSAPRKITFANANTQDYLVALQTALLLLVLSRSDLPLLDELGQKSELVAQGYKDGKWAGSQFALQATGLEDSRALLRTMFPDLTVLERPSQSPQKWRADLYSQIQQMALDIYERTGPMPGAEKAVVAATEALRTVDWHTLLGVQDSLIQRDYEKAVMAIGQNPRLPLFQALDPDKQITGMAEFGLAPNVLSMGISAEAAEELFFPNPSLTAAGLSELQVLRLREGEYVEWSGGGLEITYSQENPLVVKLKKRLAPRSLEIIYDKFTDKDGKLLIPPAWQVYLKEMSERAKGRVSTSGDMTPVFYSGATDLIDYKKGGSSLGAAIYLRGLFREYQEGVLYQQAAIALNIASAAFTRSPQDGEWVALRLFDSFPELEGFLNGLENWVLALSEATRSMADVIVKYIGFLQGIITDLQQLIRRINSLIQSLLSFSFALPEFSGLVVLSDGTDGLVSDLVSAQNKPSDVPRAYGGGIALVFPVGPSFIFDLIDLAGGQEPDPGAMTTLVRAPDAIGIEQVQPAAGAAPTNEPDVL